MRTIGYSFYLSLVFFAQISFSASRRTILPRIYGANQCAEVAPSGAHITHQAHLGLRQRVAMAIQEQSLGNNEEIPVVPIIVTVDNLHAHPAISQDQTYFFCEETNSTDHLMQDDIDTFNENNSRENIRFRQACKRGDLNIARQLLRHKAQIDSSSPHSGQKALHKAARFCDFEALELLLAHKANVKSKDRFGNTALHVLAKQKQNPSHVIKILLAHKADLLEKNKKGLRPLDCATQNTNVLAIKAFKEAMERPLK